MNGLGFTAAIIQALAWPFELRKPFDVLVSANNENGWVDWSELATLLVEVSEVVTVSMRRLLVPSLIGRTGLTR